MSTSNDGSGVAIQDVSVMLDLSRAGLVQEAFRLPVTYYTAEDVFYDLRAVQRAEFAPFIATTQLQTVAMDEAMYATIASLQPLHQEMSDKDLQVYHLATANQWPVLASCNRLRNSSQQLGLTAYSTYWVLDLLVQKSLVSIPKAGTLLQQMATANPRLAPEDYEERRQRWIC